MFWQLSKSLGDRVGLLQTAPLTAITLTLMAKARKRAKLHSRKLKRHPSCEYNVGKLSSSTGSKWLRFVR